MSAIVKGFGCRPLTAVRHTLAAGVRKPPREETALGERVAVPQSLWGFDRSGGRGGAGARRSILMSVDVGGYHWRVIEVSRLLNGEDWQDD